MDEIIIGIVGLGEAGSLYATGLAEAGVRVRGYDPVRELNDPRIEQLTSPDGLGDGAAAVLSIVGGRAALSVANDVLPLLGPDAIFADLNTTSPELKGRIAAEAVAHDVLMADVAVLAPVPRAGLATPVVVSGTGAAGLAALLGPLGVPIMVQGAAAGDAARLKLLRSVFMKGLAALVIESVAAGRDSGAEEWIIDQIAGELGEGGRPLVDRLISGTYEHVERRTHEVRDALQMLEASGLDADMTRATLAWFERIRADTR